MLFSFVKLPSSSSEQIVVLSVANDLRLSAEHRIFDELQDASAD